MVIYIKHLIRSLFLYVDQKIIDNHILSSSVKHSLSIELLPNESNEY